MARYYGNVGFVHNKEVRKGIFEDVVTERPFKGEMIRPSVRTESDPKVNSDFALGNSFSIILDAYLMDNLFAIKYITHVGVRWSVRKVDIAHPRLIITVGEVYNGPKV